MLTQSQIEKLAAQLEQRLDGGEEYAQSLNDYSYLVFGLNLLGLDCGTRGDLTGDYSYLDAE